MLWLALLLKLEQQRQVNWHGLGTDFNCVLSPFEQGGPVRRGGPD